MKINLISLTKKVEINIELENSLKVLVKKNLRKLIGNNGE